jgi:hypothetical protein
MVGSLIDILFWVSLLAYSNFTNESKDLFITIIGSLEEVITYPYP